MVSQGIMETEDADRNCFVLDVTMTDFLKEGFNISRVGGATAVGAGGLAVPKEKGAAGKRSSSRPSSGKVCESDWIRSDRVISCHIISYHMISYHIISYHITSYPII